MAGVAVETLVWSRKETKGRESEKEMEGRGNFD
jgi:hypothetical protein